MTSLTFAITSVVVISLVNCVHQKPREKSEAKWNKDFKEFCEDDLSPEEKAEEDFFENCINENDNCMKECLSKVYEVSKLPTTRDEMTKLVCKGQHGTLKKFKERDQCFLKCNDPSEKVDKYCDELLEQKFQKSDSNDD